MLHISAQSSAASGCKAGHFLLPPLLLHPLHHLHRHRPLHLLRPLPPHHENLTMKRSVVTRQIILQIEAFERINPEASRQLNPDFYVSLVKDEADKDAASLNIILAFKEHQCESDLLSLPPPLLPPAPFC